MGRHSGGNLSVKLGLILLFFISLSFALIDPPVADVNAHDLAIAPHALLHYNALNLSENDPTLDDPTTFFYVKILTLTPSVNFSVNSAMQPSLVWLAAENHNRTVEENWSDGSCTSYRRRTFSDAKLENVTAYYSLSGVLHDENGNYTFLTINDSQKLAGNASFNDPIVIPFQRNTGCSMLESFFGFFLGHQMDLSCNEDSLYRASPYPNGTINFTDRSIGVVNPELNATIYADLSIPYHEEWNDCTEGKSGCDCSGGSDDGTVELNYHDTQSYDVQNDRMTMLVYSPQFMSLDSNTSDSVVYHVSLLSTSDLYKYYSVMDNQTAGAYYLDSFDVVNDSYGTEFIVASQINHTGLLPEDPAQNYTGSEAVDHMLGGMYLRSPTEFDNASYNYSRVYDIEDTFTGLSPGAHQAELEFFTFFGNYTAQSNISVRLLTNLSVVAGPYSSDQTLVVCTLFGNDTPLPGAPVELRIGNETHTAVTDSYGGCSAIFSTSHSIDTVYASYAGSNIYLPSEVDMPFSNGLSFDAGSVAINNLGLLLILAGLLAFMFLGMARSVGGSKNPGVGRFFATRGAPKGKKSVRAKKPVSVSAASGGTGDGSAKKKDVAKKAVDERETKAKREMDEKGKKTAKGHPDEPDDKKHRKVTKGEIDINRVLYPESYELKEKYLDSRSVHAGRARELKERIQDEHIPEIENKMKTAADRTNTAQSDERTREDLQLKIIQDKNLDTFLIAHDYQRPQNTLAITIDNTVYIRESRMDDEKYLQEIIKHEDYHPYSKLHYDRCDHLVEGFNEIMKYEDMMEDGKMSPELKGQVCMVEGVYREYAAEQYLMKEIMGRDHYVVGHLVQGEDHLKEHFNRIAGDGEYDRIFGRDKNIADGDTVWVDRMSDADRVKRLLKIHEEKLLAAHDNVKTQIKRILTEGKYDI